MDLRLRIGEREYAVDVSEPSADGTRRVAIDGRSCEVAERGRIPHGVGLAIDGRRVVAHVARTPEGTWVAWDGRARLVRDARREARRRAPSDAGAAGMVTPSFPSVVEAILVAVGDEVNKGQALVVISAMKMEARLVAPHAGTVRAIRTTVGARVRPGDILVEVQG